MTFHVPNMEWHERAACRRRMPALWFPDDAGKSPTAEAAKRICRTECPVQVQCLTHAMTAPELWGIWGGLGETERSTLRRRNSRTQALRLALARTRTTDTAVAQ